MDKKSPKNIILYLLLLFLAVFQASSQLLGYSIQNKTALNSKLLTTWISLGKEISDNWLTFSILLITIVACSLIYSITFYNDDHPISMRSIASVIGLLAINLILCNRVYSLESVLQKALYLSKHIPTMIIFLIIILFTIAICAAVIYRWRIRKEIDDPANLAEPLSEQKSNVTAEKFERIFWKHPKIYLRLLRKYNAVERRKLKDDIRVENLLTKHIIKKEKKRRILEDVRNGEITSYNSANHIASIIIAILSFLATAGIFVLMFVFSDYFLNLIAELIKKLQTLIDYSEILQNISSPLTMFLLSLGVLFLITILFLVIYLLIYVSIRMIYYYFANADEDSDRISKYALLIKIFVFDVIDSAIRPLLFIPDFLKVVEEFVLDTDLDEKIKEAYPNKCTDDKGTTKKPGS